MLKTAQDLKQIKGELSDNFYKSTTASQKVIKQKQFKTELAKQLFVSDNDISGCMIKDEHPIVTEKINNWFKDQHEFEEEDEKILS